MSFWSRLTNVFRSRHIERDIDEELRFHVEERMRALADEGLSREAAAARVGRQFGSHVRLREQSRDVRLLPWLDSLVRDVRLGARMLRKNAVVTMAAIVSLSLALGACLAAFSLVDALILRPLPVHEPERLIYLTFPSINPEQPDEDTFSDPAFVQLRDAGRGQVDLFAMGHPERSRVTFDTRRGDRETVRTQFVSGDAFERLGVRPAAGRVLTIDDDRQPGAHPFAVVSHAFWMQRFGGDPAIVGRWFVVHNERHEDRQFQIVGVTEPRFTGVEPGRATDVWLPYAMQNPYAFGNGGYSTIRVMGRLRPQTTQTKRPQITQTTMRPQTTQTGPQTAQTAQTGPQTTQTRGPQTAQTRSDADSPNPFQSVFRGIRLWLEREGAAVEQAQSVLRVAFTNFRREQARAMTFPSGDPDRATRFINTPLSVRSAATGPSRIRTRFERPLWILTAIAALVLLIAGSNVANLFLARTAVREREMSLRLSLGAGRGRLIQQLLIESALVAGAACVIGVIFAAVTAPAVVGMLTSTDDPVVLHLGLDWPLVSVCFGVTLLITALFGLAPALRASSARPMTALNAGGARNSARASAARPFLALQVAFSLIVLFVGSLLVRSFVKLSTVNPGFAASDVLLVSWEPAEKMAWNQQRMALLQVLDRLRDVPGVAAVSAAEFNALDRTWRNNVAVPGREAIEATMAPVAPGFFETMKIPLLAGRTFVRRDLETERPTAVIVNQSFATRYFGGEPAVGRLVDVRFGQTNAPKEVLGVVADVRYDLRKPPAPTVYLLLPIQSHRTLHVRVAGDTATIASRLRDDVRAAAPLFRVTSITSQTAIVNRALVRERLLALLSGFFALVGLVLTAVGLYGVLSYAVVQRTREIGIRVALGARSLGAVRSVVADTAGTTLVGAACGLAGGLYASRFVEVLLFEVAARDVWSLALPLGTLLVAALIAAAVPAWRAARVDPVIALRND